ncbi:tetratricopeptide repeat protein [Verrucomicrobiota bacterium]
MTIRNTLDELRGSCKVEMPTCRTHPDQLAVAFCGTCNAPLCGTCVTVVPTEARCAGCRPASDRVLENRGVWLTTFLAGLLRKPWAIALLVGSVLFVLLILFLPHTLEPSRPNVPEPLRGMPIEAPYLQKTFRLGSLGDLWQARERAALATGYFRRAAIACRKHVAQEKDAYLKLQARLGVARLQAKAGDYEEAVQTYEKLLAEPNPGPTAGVAQFRLGQIYEFKLKDPKRAVAHYRAALQYSRKAESLSGAVSAVLDFHADDGAGGKSVLAIASLTDTLSDAGAAHQKITESLARLTGKPVTTKGAVVAVTPKRPAKAAPPIDNDPLIIIVEK